MYVKLWNVFIFCSNYNISAHSPWISFRIIVMVVRNRSTNIYMASASKPFYEFADGNLFDAHMLKLVYRYPERFIKLLSQHSGVYIKLN